MRTYLVSVLLLCLSLVCTSQEATSYIIDATYDADSLTLDAKVKISIKNTSSMALDHTVVNLYADAFVDKRSYFIRQEVDAGNLPVYFTKSKYTKAYQQLAARQGGLALNIDHDFLIREVAVIQLAQQIAPGEVDTIELSYKLYIPEKLTTQGYEEDSTAFYDLWYPTIATYSDGQYEINAYDGLPPTIGPVQTDVTLTVPFPYRPIIASSLMSGSSTEVSTVVDKPLPLVITRRQGKLIEAEVGDQSIALNYVAYRNIGASTIDEVTNVSKYMLSQLGLPPYDQVRVVEQISETANIYREGLITLRPQASTEDLPAALASLYLDRLFNADMPLNLKTGLTMLYQQRYATVDGQSLTFDNCSNCSYYQLLKYYYAATQPLSLQATEDTYRHKGDALVNGSLRPLLFWTHVYAYTRASWDAAMIDARAMDSRLSLQGWLNVLERRSGKSLSWTTGVMSAKPLDYEVRLSRDYVRVINHGDVKAPMPVSVLVDGEEVEIWTTAVETDTTFVVKDAQAATLDQNDITLDFAEENNTSFADNAPTVSLLRPDNESFNQVNLIPGFNFSDRWMLGIALSSTDKLPTKWQYLVAPMWSFGARDLVGLADVRRNFKLNADKLDRLVLGLSGRHFHYDADRPETFATSVVDEDRRPITGSIHNGFYRVQPYASLFFEGGDRTRALHLSTTYVVEQDMIYSPIVEDVLQGIRIDRRSRFLRASYQDDGYGKLTNTDFSLDLEFGDYADVFRTQQQYLKVSADLIKSWSYDGAGHQFSIRFWGGAMLDNTAADLEANALNYRGVLALSHQNFNDYTYDEFHFDRLSNAAFLTRQVNYRRGGGFTHVTGTASNASVGQSQRFAFSSNLVMDLPIADDFFPVQATFDIGGYSRRLGLADRDLAFLYSAGLRINYGDVVVNIPIVYSDAFSRGYDGASFWRRISFSIKYPLYNSWTEDYENIKH